MKSNAQIVELEKIGDAIFPTRIPKVGRIKVVIEKMPSMVAGLP